MRKLIIQFLSNILALWLLAYFTEKISYGEKWQTLVLASLVLAIANLLVKPILKILSLPLIIISLGLFSVVINAVILYTVPYFVKDFRVEGLLTALVGAIVISFINVLTNSLFKKDK